MNKMQEDNEKKVEKLFSFPFFGAVCGQKNKTVHKVSLQSDPSSLGRPDGKMVTRFQDVSIRSVLRFSSEKKKKKSLVSVKLYRLSQKLTDLDTEGMRMTSQHGNRSQVSVNVEVMKFVLTPSPERCLKFIEGMHLQHFQSKDAI